jgi:hypothetical protein
MLEVAATRVNKNGSIESVNQKGAIQTGPAKPAIYCFPALLCRGSGRTYCWMQAGGVCSQRWQKKYVTGNVDSTFTFYGDIYEADKIDPLNRFGRARCGNCASGLGTNCRA